MSYNILKTEKGYDILEKETGIIIQLNKEEREAKNLCRKLNLGSGFVGWTPVFIAEKLV